MTLVEQKVDVRSDRLKQQPVSGPFRNRLKELDALREREVAERIGNHATAINLHTLEVMWMRADDRIGAGIKNASIDLESSARQDLQVDDFGTLRRLVGIGTGQIDVGAGSPSAGLYNAIARGLKIKIVADKAYSPAGYGATKLVIRKDHVDSGRFKSLADLGANAGKFGGKIYGIEAGNDGNRIIQNKSVRSVFFAPLTADGDPEIRVRCFARFLPPRYYAKAYPLELF